MHIGSREREETRTHIVAGKKWKFTRADPEATLVCDVTDPAAVAVFLSERNAAVFYPLEAPKPLTRGARGHDNPTGNTGGTDPNGLVKLLDQGVRKIRDELAAGAWSAAQLATLLDAEREGSSRATVLAELEKALAKANEAALGGAGQQAHMILDNDEGDVLQMLESITDPQLLAAARVVEQAGAARPAVLAKLGA